MRSAANAPEQGTRLATLMLKAKSSACSSHRRRRWWLGGLSGGRLEEIILGKGAPYEIAPANGNSAKPDAALPTAHDLAHKAALPTEELFSSQAKVNIRRCYSATLHLARPA